MTGQSTGNGTDKPHQSPRIRTLRRWQLAFVTVSLAFSLGSCGDASPDDERVAIRYWEKWTGFEGDAIRTIVDDFNASQDRIRVEITTVSDINRKLMLATAGGVPPDVAGIWASDIPVFAENNALRPLDNLAEEKGIGREDYINIFWYLCSHRGHLWALPSTPATTALIWNKKLFREAGLDPEKPPRSIAELEAFNEKLIKWRPDGSIQSFGHLPEEPGWWNALWGGWFGGRPSVGDRTITIETPENIAAYQWVESYPKRFGAEQLVSFRDGFGNFASPQNAFFTGRVAMVMQGAWIYNFIKNYAPADFEWGVAPFPSVDPDRLKDVTVAECDALVIPAGTRHPREAFEFLHYVNSQGPMEKLCLLQRKFTPLHEVSEEFFDSHPNPYIQEFAALARSENVLTTPRLTTWSEFRSDMQNAVSRIWSGKATAEEALHDVQVRQQKILDQRVTRWDRHADELTEEWNNP